MMFLSDGNFGSDGHVPLRTNFDNFSPSCPLMPTSDQTWHFCSLLISEKLKETVTTASLTIKMSPSASSQHKQGQNKMKTS